jgi:hypothetical protein
MQENTFTFIEESYNIYKTLLPELLNLRHTLDKDYINEYIHLLSNINFSFENLYAHDIDQPGEATLQRDYSRLMSNCMRFINYCLMINYNVENRMHSFYWLIHDIKTQYYNEYD